MTHRRWLGVLGVACLCACGPSREALPPPRAPLVAHLTLPGPPPASPLDIARPSLRVEDLVLPCGIEVHVVERPDALLTHLALFAGGGYLGDGTSAPVDVAVLYALEEHLGASVSLDTRGLSVVAEADGSEALGRAAQLVRVATGQSLSPALLRRAGESPEAIGADRREHDLVARIYGTHSPEAALASPDRSRHAVASVRVRERIAQLFQPSRMRLVVVGPLERGALERALTEATQGIAPTPHAAPRTLEPRTWAPPRPQVRVYGGDLSLGAISALAPGPPVGAADHAAFRVAVRILGGMYSSRPNQVFREERRESYGAHAVVLDNGTHSLVRFETTIETPQINAVLDVVFDELGRLGDAAALSDEEIERARRLEIAAETLRWDDGGSLASSILDARVRGERPSPERALESLRAVDRAAIAEASRRWLAPDRLAIVATGRSTWMFSHPPAAPGGYAVAE